jgi:hypothetical protein
MVERAKEIQGSALCIPVRTQPGKYGRPIVKRVGHDPNVGFGIWDDLVFKESMLWKVHR